MASSKFEMFEFIIFLFSAQKFSRYFENAFAKLKFVPLKEVNNVSTSKDPKVGTSSR
jgi:hypothetical protein